MNQCHLVLMFYLDLLALPSFVYLFWLILEILSSVLILDLAGWIGRERWQKNVPTQIFCSSCAWLSPYVVPSPLFDDLVVSHTQIPWGIEPHLPVPYSPFFFYFYTHVHHTPRPRLLLLKPIVREARIPKVPRDHRIPWARLLILKHMEGRIH